MLYKIYDEEAEETLVDELTYAEARVELTRYLNEGCDAYLTPSASQTRTEDQEHD